MRLRLSLQVFRRIVSGSFQMQVASCHVGTSAFWVVEVFFKKSQFFFALLITQYALNQLVYQYILVVQETLIRDRPTP